jgi:hypothetical protein
LGEALTLGLGQPGEGLLQGLGEGAGGGVVRVTVEVLGLAAHGGVLAELSGEAPEEAIALGALAQEALLFA